MISKPNSDGEYLVIWNDPDSGANVASKLEWYNDAWRDKFGNEFAYPDHISHWVPEMNNRYAP